MKLNNIKTGLLLAGLLLLFGNVKAQDNPFKPEWFVSGGINGVTALNRQTTYWEGKSPAACG